MKSFLLKRISRPTIFLVFFLSLNNISTSQENLLSYHPNVAGSLVFGQGIDIFNVASGAGVAFKDISSNNVVDTTVNVGKSEIFITAITNEKQLQSSLGISASMNLSFWGTSISASFDNLRSSIYSSNSILIAVTAEADYGTKKLRKENLELSDEAKKLKVSKKYNDFFQQYGHHYITAVGRKQLVSVFISIEGISQEEKTSVSAKFGIKTSYLFMKADAQASINSLITSTSSSKKVSLHSFYLGKNHNYIEDSKILENLKGGALLNLDNIEAVLNSYLKNLRPENSVELNYFLASYSNFGLPSVANYDMGTPKFIQVVNLYDELHHLSSISTEINNLTNIAVSTNFSYYANKSEKKTVREKLQTIAEIVSKFQTNLEEYKKCDTKTNSCDYKSVYKINEQITDIVSLAAAEDDFNDLVTEMFEKYSQPPYAKLNTEYLFERDGQLLTMGGAVPGFSRNGVNAAIRLTHLSWYKILKENYESFAKGPRTVEFDIEILRPAYIADYSTGIPRIVSQENIINNYSIDLDFVSKEQITIGEGDKSFQQVRYPFRRATYNYNRSTPRTGPADVYTNRPNIQSATYDPNIPMEFMLYDKIHFSSSIDFDKLNYMDNVLLNINNFTPNINTAWIFIKSYKLIVK
jgi:hypothetical protein